jgi:asparagine synthase (glutamine-hydrolysing)
MCGYSVIVSKSSNVVSSAINSFDSNLSHRGPDYSGKIIIEAGNKYIGFGHRRLSILDLSARGNQPMQEGTSGNIIVFNGEIYNFKSLQDSLRSSGETFNSNSDTEVILKGYRLWGIKKLLKKINGMFSFCIWDNKLNELIIIRDPLGIKPLYFHNHNGTFVCASEVKSIIKSGLVSNEIDIQSIDSFLAYGSVQPPRTIYTDIKSLMPGHIIRYSLERDYIDVKRYWSWNVDDAEITLDDISKAFENSIKRNLVSDVPIGILLSGGYDSTAMALLASRFSKQEVSSYTLAFSNNKAYSENISAKKIADFCGIAHSTINISSEDIESLFSNYFSSMDQPSEDGFNVYLISKFLRETGKKVFLHGVGGDELFGGYPSFKDVPKALLLQKIPSNLKSFLHKIIPGKSISSQKIKELLQLDLGHLNAMYVRRNLFGFDERMSLINIDVDHSNLALPKSYYNFIENNINNYKQTSSKISIHEITQYTGSKLLTDGDVMSMAFGLEFRFPLLDTELINKTLNLREKMGKELKSIQNKSFIVDAIKGFPEHLMSKKKMGFTIPLKEILEKKMKKEHEEINEILIEELNFKPDGLNSFWNWYFSSKDQSAWLRAWQLFTLSEWTKTHSFKTNY